MWKLEDIYEFSYFLPEIPYVDASFPGQIGLGAELKTDVRLKGFGARPNGPGR